jgi:hypothetical protein
VLQELILEREYNSGAGRRFFEVESSPRRSELFSFVEKVDVAVIRVSSSF